jgi:hypothetical protein
MRVNEEELMSELIQIISENVTDVKDQKAVYTNLVELFMDSLAVDSLAKAMGENSLFDEIYEDYIKDNQQDVDEEFDDEQY